MRLLVSGKPLRILHLVSYPWFSGPMSQVTGLAWAQRAAGHESWVGFDRKRGHLATFEEPAAPRIVGTELEEPFGLTLSTKSSVAQWWSDFRTLRRISREVDVIHVHMSHDHGLAAMAGVRRHVPCVRTFHAARSLEPRLGQKIINRMADGWVVRSSDHQQRLRSLVSVPEDRVRVIPGSIDAEFFKPVPAERRRAARERFGIARTAKVLAHVALIAGRGQEELAGALVRVNSPDLHVLYVGSGEDEEALKLLAKGIGLEGKAHFTGYLKGDDLLDAYAAADAAFLAQAGNDASCRAALEAMACGLPVLGIQQDALAELVTPEVGFPIPSRKPDAIAGVLREWLAADHGPDRGARGRELVLAERTFERQAEETQALYLACLGSAQEVARAL